MQLLYRNVQWFRDGLVFKAHRLVYHSTIGLRVIKKKKTEHDTREQAWFVSHGTFDHQIVLFNCLDVYHKSPDSGERQCKSRA